MPGNYIPILVFLLLAFAFPVVALTLAALVRPSAQSGERLTPYECGITPVSDSRGRYTVRFYIIAMLFVVFDVETVFLYPWAVQYKALKVFGLVEMLVFLAILLVGYIWLYKKGALEWV